ncbi:hypothetical protein CER19_27610 [Pseudomonas sp. GL93]|uniref:fimbrial protein n=1 Tax=Pseudomonas sp. GL93 TaxID=2014741 RepID=UPI000E317CA4|nr:fimbrial protein [Pseudomonas sp. GL93]RFD23998.1 hypothetical protein CER19_27610 [Pseudomonas sp. GL93]
MKWKIFFSVCFSLSVSTVQAKIIDGCHFVNGGRDKQVRIAASPTTISLRNVPVGSVMATSRLIPVSGTGHDCGALTEVQQDYSIVQGALAEGFTDVYQTGISGVGVRIMDYSFGDRESLPYTRKYSRPSSWIQSISSLVFEYVRTSRKISMGKAAMEFTVQVHVNYWNSLEVRFTGDTDFQSEAYFSGCEGVEKLNIPMGRVSIGNLGVQQKSFNLDVKCSGMKEGAKVPVNVYFEGDSNGPGRLNLEPGGAEGVELKLRNNNNVQLPFTAGNAMSMVWMRSEPGGEIYRLPVVAEYTKKAFQKVKPGKANATLNYILEYN